MATSVKNNLWAAFRATLADLAPFPGRAATAWRVAVVCALVAGIAMMFEIPESAISVYLVLYLMKDDGALNTIIGCAAIIAVTLLVAAMIPVIQWTIESALIRVMVMALVSVIFIYIGAATKLGEGGSIVALIIAFILSLMDQIPVNGVISFALRYAWYMTILPMFVIAGFCLYFGRWSVSLQKQDLRERLIAARDALFLDQPGDSEALRNKLEEGNDAAGQRSMLIKILHQTSSKRGAKISADILSSYQLIYAVAALPETTADNVRNHYHTQIDAIVTALDQGKDFPATAEFDTSNATSQELALAQALRNLCGIENTPYVKGVNDSFIAPDARTNPIYMRFALKTTLAAMLCYMFYSAINWQGIHTAMVTCYVASMGTAGDTIHKLGLRISGALIGAAIAVLSIKFFIPHMENVGSLMVLVFFVGLLSAWVSAGSEKISYAGVQIGLAFTLTVLSGFAPSTDADAARDRIVGILVGNFAVYLVSTLIWPSPINTNIKDNLSKAVRKIADVAAFNPAARLQKIATLSEMEKLLGDVRYCLYLLPFEPRGLRPTPEQEKLYREMEGELATLGKEVYFSKEELSEISARLNSLSDKIITSGMEGSMPPETNEDLIGSASQAQQKNIAMHVNHLELIVASKNV